MADTTQFTIGTEASCSDGAVGKLIRVIVDPTVEEVTHLAVEPEHRPDLGRLVPLDLVDFGGAAGEIRLRCTKAEFENLDPAEDTQIIPATDVYGGYGAGQIGYMPYYGLEGGGMAVPGVGLGAGAIAPQVVATDSVPLGEVEIRRGEPVQATDGDIGRVQGLVIDPAQPPRDPRAAAGGPPVGEEGGGDPDRRGDQHPRRHPAQDQQAGGAGSAAGGRQPSGEKALNHSSERTVGDCGPPGAAADRGDPLRSDHPRYDG